MVNCYAGGERNLLNIRNMLIKRKGIRKGDQCGGKRKLVILLLCQLITKIRLILMFYVPLNFIYFLLANRRSSFLLHL